MSFDRSVLRKAEPHVNALRWQNFLSAVLIIVAFTLLYLLIRGRISSLPISFLCGITLCVFGIVAFVFGNEDSKHKLSLLFISLGAIVFGGLNGGLFGIGAGAIFWPVVANLAFKSPRLIGLAANLLTFFAIAMLGLASGQIPTFENPILPSILSLGLSAFVLNALYGFYNSSFFKKDQLKELESAKQEAISAKHQSQARTSFIAEMSHEIRTPLNHILGFSELMSNEVFGPLNTQYKEYASLINQSGQHLSDLVGDILDMSKIEAGKYRINSEPLDIKSLCEETFRLAKGSAKFAGLSLNFYGQNDCMITADKRAIKQIILNLLSNAIKYTDAGGRVDLRQFGNEDHIWLEVSDTGRGMSDEEILRIGEPYLNGQSNDGAYRSTGLGLALVKNLTLLQMAEFNIWSQRGRGTNVSIKFPRLKQMQQ